jgi:hypothetical protein
LREERLVYHKLFALQADGGRVGLELAVAGAKLLLGFPDLAAD